MPNPYHPPEPIRDISRTSLVTEDVTTLRRMLIGFGLVASLVPLALSPFIDALLIDPFAGILCIQGLRLNKESFKRFPWAALLCCMFYPIASIFVLTTANVFVDPADWYIPRRGLNSLPHAFNVFIACWSSLNAYLVVRHYQRAQQASGTTD